MRILPILIAAAMGTFAASAAVAQAGPGSNQPPGQATTTQSSEQRLDTDSKGMASKNMTKKHAKKTKKSHM